MAKTAWMPVSAGMTDLVGIDALTKKGLKLLDTLNGRIGVVD